MVKGLKIKKNRRLAQNNTLHQNCDLYHHSAVQSRELAQTLHITLHYSELLGFRQFERKDWLIYEE